MVLLNIESLYSKIFYSALVAIGVTDAKGNYVIVNPTWCELLGYSMEEANKINIKDVTLKDDWDDSIISFDYLIAKEGRSIRKNRRYISKDGTTFWADLHASSIYDDNDKAIGLLGIFVNIDKQVIAEQIQRELYLSMEQLNNDLSIANTGLSMLARHDSLTGLYNRRVLDEIFLKESSRSQRTKRGFGVAIADLDNFKHINDTYGHECGDIVLKEVSRLFLEGVRTTDSVGRWGGEEFLFIFTETSCQGAMIVIERIRKAVEKEEICCKTAKIHITVTIGLSYHEGGDVGKDMLSEADLALYRGKQNGKNRVVCHQDVCSITG